MSQPTVRGSTRPLEEINQEIRAIWDGRDNHRLPAADRERYHQLLAEYETTHRALAGLIPAA
jgi:hypothetical protein